MNPSEKPALSEIPDPIALRKDYAQRQLDESELMPSPEAQLSLWLQEAAAAGSPEPNAMGLSTIDPDGRPASRIVLLRGLDETGLSFFTNYDSRKGQALGQHPMAALLFFWPEVERQVRVEGWVEPLEASLSDAYYQSRPRQSRIGAWASPQSQVIPSRDWLEARVRSAEAEQPEAPPRPPNWGGYRLVPDRFEFWQGRPSRLHDRLEFRRQSDQAWQVVRLAP